MMGEVISKKVAIPSPQRFFKKIFKGMLKKNNILGQNLIKYKYHIHIEKHIKKSRQIPFHARWVKVASVLHRFIKISFIRTKITNFKKIMYD